MFTAAPLKTRTTALLLAICSAVLYVVFAYYLERTQYLKLTLLYSGLFLLFYKLIQLYKHNTRFLTLIAFIFRALFIFAIPNLSQDFYRFIWDGRLLLEGFNPYLYTPESFIAAGKTPVAQAHELYVGMRELSASHFTNYPPLNQLCFVIAGIFANSSILGSVVILKLIIIAADFGTLHFGKKLLAKLKLPVYNIFWYILNPFIIIELTGNLHFEGVMIFFLVWSLYLLHIGKWKQAAVVFACSVSVKLIPLLFLPLFFKWFRTVRNTSGVFKTCEDFKQVENLKTVKNNKWIPARVYLERSRKAGMTKLFTFYAIIGATTLLLFLPFYSSEFVNNYAATVGLWFSNFEFNASIYYVAREVGFWFRGYNEIAIIGKVLPIITFVVILCLALYRKNTSLKKLITAMLLSFTIYLFLSTTVHPWYIATVLILSIFTNYKFPIVWSFIIILSYLAYANTDNTENLWLVALQYVVVYSVFIWEVFIKRKTIDNN